jgi:hypothetical protein
MQSQNTLKKSTYIGPKLADSLAERCAPVFPTIEVSFKLSNKGYRKIWLSMCQSFFFWKSVEGMRKVSLVARRGDAYDGGMCYAASGERGCPCAAC